MKAILFTLLLLSIVSADSYEYDDLDSLLDEYDELESLLDEYDYMLKDSWADRFKDLKAGIEKYKNRFNERAGQATDAAMHVVAENGDTINNAISAGRKSIKSAKNGALVVAGAGAIAGATGYGLAVAEGAMKVNQALGKADKIAGYVQDGAKTFIEGAKSYDSARQEGKSRGEAALAGGKSMAIEGAKIGAKFAVGKVVDGIADKATEKISNKLSDTVYKGVEGALQKRGIDTSKFNDIKSVFGKEKEDKNGNKYKAINGTSIFANAITSKIKDNTIGKLTDPVKDTVSNIAKSGIDIAANSKEKGADFGKAAGEHAKEGVKGFLKGINPAEKIKEFGNKVKETGQKIANVGKDFVNGVKNGDKKAVGDALKRAGGGAVRALTGWNKDEASAVGKIGGFALKTKLGIGKEEVDTLKGTKGALKQLFQKGGDKKDALKKLGKSAKIIQQASTNLVLPGFLTPGAMKLAKRAFDNSALGKGIKSDLKELGQDIKKGAKGFADEAKASLRKASSSFVKSLKDPKNALALAAAPLTGGASLAFVAGRAAGKKLKQAAKKVDLNKVRNVSGKISKAALIAAPFTGGASLAIAAGASRVGRAAKLASKFAGKRAKKGSMAKAKAAIKASNKVLKGAKSAAPFTKKPIRTAKSVAKAAKKAKTLIKKRK